MQPILTFFAQPNDQSIVPIVFIDHSVIITNGAVIEPPKPTETVSVLHSLTSIASVSITAATPTIPQTKHCTTLKSIPTSIGTMP